MRVDLVEPILSCQTSPQTSPAHNHDSFGIDDGMVNYSKWAPREMLPNARKKGRALVSRSKATL